MKTKQLLMELKQLRELLDITEAKTFNKFLTLIIKNFSLKEFDKHSELINSIIESSVYYKNLQNFFKTVSSIDKIKRCVK